MSDAHIDLAVERWLTQKHRALVDDLTTILDVDAGLQEAVIRVRHADLVRDLQELLDVEAGLAAVVASSNDAIQGSVIEPETIAAPVLTQLHQLLSQAASHSPRDRLEFRTHATLVDRNCSCIRSRTEILRAVLKQLTDIGGALDRVQDVSLDDAHALMRSLDARFRGSASQDFVFGIDLDYCRELVFALSRSLRTNESLDESQVLVRSLAADLDYLDSILNDFTSADLRRVDLHGLRLEGVRWSSQTEWPSRWVERIRRISDKIGPDVFLVRPQ